MATDVPDQFSERGETLVATADHSCQLETSRLGAPADQASRILGRRRVQGLAARDRRPMFGSSWLLAREGPPLRGRGLNYWEGGRFIALCSVAVTNRDRHIRFTHADHWTSWDPDVAASLGNDMVLSSKAAGSSSYKPGRGAAEAYCIERPGVSGIYHNVQAPEVELSKLMLALTLSPDSGRLEGHGPSSTTLPLPI